jgi:hypothetical protein
MQSEFRLRQREWGKSESVCFACSPSARTSKPIAYCILNGGIMLRKQPLLARCVRIGILAPLRSATAAFGRLPIGSLGMAMNGSTRPSRRIISTVQHGVAYQKTPFLSTYDCRKQSAKPLLFRCSRPNYDAHATHCLAHRPAAASAQIVLIGPPLQAIETRVVCQPVHLRAQARNSTAAFRHVRK